MDYIIHNTVLRLSPGTPQGSGRIYCVRITLYILCTYYTPQGTGRIYCVRITLCIVYVLYCVRIYTPQGTGRI